MANEGHVILLKASVAEWNDWRLKNSRIIPNLSGADLSERNLAGAFLYTANLSGVNLGGACLKGANLNQANLFRVDGAEADFTHASFVKANLSQTELVRADFRNADFSEATLVRANLSGANLSGANLRAANLGQAFLFRANLSRATLAQASFFKADLSEADLSGSNLAGANFHAATLDKANLSGAAITNANLYSALFLRANLENAVLANCSIYGASFCGVNLEGAKQKDLDIMPVDQPAVSVNNLELGQLVGLLLHHEKVRAAVESMTLRSVLVLGKFPPGRRPVYDALAEALRLKDYAPLLMDFDAPGSRNMTESIKILGRISKFVVADLTDDPGIIQVLDAIVHYLPGVPILPILESGKDEAGQDRHYQRYNWVLPVFRFEVADDLAGRFALSVVTAAEDRWAELRKR